MFKEGMKLIAETAAEHLLATAANAHHDEIEIKTEEQKQFDRRVKIAQNVLGMVCPPAGRAMYVLEHGSVVAAESIQKVWSSDAVKCLGGWVKRRF